jgi:HEPN domain-containing protein
MAAKAVYQKIGAEAFGHSVAGLLSRLPTPSILKGPKPKEKREREKRKVAGGRREDFQQKMEELVSIAKELDKSYISARYPNSHPEGAPYAAYTEAEARRSIDYAERIIRFCEDLLSSV